MDLNSLPNPTVIYDQDIHWPSTASALGSNSGFDTNGEYQNGIPFVNLWGALGGGGTTTMDLMAGINLPCARFVSTGATSAQRGLLGFSAYVPLSVGTLPAGFKYPTSFRVWRWQFVMRMSAAVNSTLNCNCSMMCAAGAAPGVISTNNPGFGIAGSGVTPGTWAYISRRVSAPGLAEVVELGLSQTVPLLVDFVILAASISGAAKMQLFLNGNYSAPAVERSFIAGGLLPFYGDPANSMRFTPFVEQSDQVNPGTLQVGAVRCLMGQFNATGAPV